MPIYKPNEELDLFFASAFECLLAICDYLDLKKQVVKVSKKSKK